MVIFICGIPASGKSSFGKFLENKHGYFYIDMEHNPWPDENIHKIWDLIFQQLGDESRISSFLDSLETKGEKVVLDLGFVPNDAYYWIVATLKKYGCRVIWFNCSYNIAKKRFLNRKTSPPLELFELQIERIKNNWGIIASMVDPEVVEVTAENGSDKTKIQIYEEIFKR